MLRRWLYYGKIKKWKNKFFKNLHKNLGTFLWFRTQNYRLHFVQTRDHILWCRLPTYYYSLNSKTIIFWFIFIIRTLKYNLVGFVTFAYSTLRLLVTKTTWISSSVAEKNKNSVGINENFIISFFNNNLLSVIKYKNSKISNIQKVFRENRAKFKISFEKFHAWLVCLVNSSFLSIMACTGLFQHLEYFSDPFEGSTEIGTLSLTICAGYFLYDALENAKKSKITIHFCA